MPTKLTYLLAIPLLWVSVFRIGLVIRLAIPSHMLLHSSVEEYSGNYSNEFNFALYYYYI